MEYILKSHLEIQPTKTNTLNPTCPLSFLSSSFFLKDRLIFFTEALRFETSPESVRAWAECGWHGPVEGSLHWPLEQMPPSDYHSSCLIKLSSKCRAISTGKWRFYLKWLGAVDKQNVIIWAEIQLTSQAANARGSWRIRHFIWSQCVSLQPPLLPVPQGGENSLHWATGTPEFGCQFLLEKRRPALF